jgi:arylsulfatase A-like enzyme
MKWWVKKKTVLIIIFFSLIAIFFFGLIIFPKEYSCIDCNLVIISITNLRSDHLHFNNYSRETSSNIDKFAKESIVFENAFSQASWTLPSGTSLMTSLYPPSHKLVDRYSGEFLSGNITTLTDILNSNGYNTAAFTGGFDYSLRYNVINRFSEVETFDKPYPESDNSHFIKVQTQSINLYGDFSQTIPAATNWLEKNAGKKKFFLFVQGFDAHCPFTPPDPYDRLFDSNYTGGVDFSTCIFTYGKTEAKTMNGEKVYFANQFQFDNNTKSYVVKNVTLNEDDVRHLIALYDGEIKAADNWVGKLIDKIDELGLSKKTIVVITSEHGDMLGEKGRFMRGGPLVGTFYENVLHVPLLIRHPNLGSRRIDGLVQLIDVMPTLLEFLNIKIDIKIEGKSLLPLILRNEPVNDFAFSGAEFTPTENNLFFNDSTLTFSIRNKEWKLIRETTYFAHNKSFVKNVNYELYNIKDDCEEMKNVFDDYKEVGRSLDVAIRKKFGI